MSGLPRAAALLIASAALAAPGAGGGASAAAGTRPFTSSCSLPALDRAARCGSIVVPEVRGALAGRTIALRVAVVPALGGHPRPDPIVILVGGPGESAVEDAAVYAGWLAPLLHDRDLLLVDQRGAGGSAPLTCPRAQPGDPSPLLKDTFPPDAVRRCVAALSRRADLTRYGYADFADDLEQVRTTFGYGRLNLFGGSYGTRAEQVYLRRHPGSVRTAFLGSVVPIDIPTPQTMARTAQAAIDRLFAACAADRRCSAAYPRLSGEFATILRRLDRGEATARVAGQDERTRLHTAPAVAWVRATLYRPSSAAILPWAIHQAYRGDWTPIADGAAETARSSLSFGLFFAITCNEDVRFIEPVAAAREARGSFLGESRVRQQQAACRYWPRSALPGGYRAPVRSDVPALFVTGEADGGTPVWFTDHAARSFPNSAIVLAPGQGHTEWSPCVAARYFRLVRDGTVGDPRRSRCPPVPPPPFKL